MNVEAANTTSELARAGVDAQSGAYTTGELLERLNSEITRAQRYGRRLSVLTVAVHALERSPEKAKPAMYKAIVQILQNVTRRRIDWVGRLQGAAGEAMFAVVLPEAGVADGAAIKERLAHAVQAGAVAAAFDFGFASLDAAAGEPVDAADLLAVAASCGMCRGRSSVEQRNAVQLSIRNHAVTSCRHGYAVDAHCLFRMSEAGR